MKNEMFGKTTEEIIEEVLKQEKEEENVDSFGMKYEENNITVFNFGIRSKSREGLVHKVIIVTQDDYFLAKACDCEGFKYHHKCWHVSYAIDWLKKHNLW